MRLLVVMSVYNEEALLGRAIRSLAPVGVDALHVFDGAWRGGRNGGHVFDGARSGASTDGTRGEATSAARDAGIPLTIHGMTTAWPSQEGKRTAMFHDSGGEPGDYLLVMDADETVAGDEPDVDGTWAASELHGWLETVRPPSGAHVHMKCVGPNDMPGIRGEWPHGDYAPFFKPELRIFAYHRDLECAWPGGYWSRGDLIRPYSDDPSTPGEPALPVAPLWMLHHGNDRSAERKAAKVAYYEVEHPERERWQSALRDTR